MSVSQSNALKCNKPDRTLGPRDFLKYLEQCERTFQQSTHEHVSTAVNLPSAFKDTTKFNTPKDEDHAIDAAYNTLADPTNEAKKPVDNMNKRLFQLMYEAAQDHTMLKGIMESAPFTRYSTFKAFIIDKFGATSKVAKTNLTEIKAEIAPNPNHMDKLINIDQHLKVSDTTQTTQFFADIAASQNKLYKMTTKEHPIEAVFQLIEFRLKELPSNTGHGKRYSDEEWKTIDAQKADIAQLEHVITNLDLEKPGEDVVDAQHGDYDAMSTGGGSINYMARNQRGGGNNGGGGGGNNGGGGAKLAYGPSETKSRSECPHGDRCRRKGTNTCFYRHGKRNGITDWPTKPTQQPAREGRDKKGQHYCETHGHGGHDTVACKNPRTQETTGLKEHLKKASVGQVYMIQDKGDGKRLYVQDTDTGDDGTAPPPKQAPKKRKGKQKLNVSFGLGMVCSMALAIGALFGGTADASNYNTLGDDDERANTFHTAYSIAPASTHKGSNGNTVIALDTGCSTAGCCNDAKKFFNLKLKSTMKPIRAANGQLIKVCGIGDIKMEMTTNTGKAIVLIRDVYFVPALSFNVFSGASFIKDDFSFTQNKGTGSTMTLPDKTTIIKLEQHNGLQLFNGKILTRNDTRPAVNDDDGTKLDLHCHNIVAGLTQPTAHTVDDLIAKLNNAPLEHRSRDPIRKALAKLHVYTSNQPSTDGILQMHAALGHPSAERLTTFLKSYLSPKQLHKQFGAIASIWCEGCELSKVTRAKKTGAKMQRSEHFAKGTTYDVIGPYNHAKGTGFKYAVVLVDEATNHITVRGLKTLKDVPRALDDHFSWLHTVQGKSVREKRLYQGHISILHPDATKRVHSDAATYFLSAEAKEVYKKHNATHTTSSPYAQHQNRTERQIRTLKSTANAMLIASHGTKGNGLTDDYWFFALARAAHCYNILPTTTNEHFISPQECITGQAPTHHHEHVFGHPCVALRMTKRKSTDPAKGELGIWLGFNTSNKSHIIHVPRDGTSGAFRQTRHIRLPKRLLSHQLLNGSVTLDAETEYVNHRTRFGGEGGGSAAPTTGGGSAAPTTQSQPTYAGGNEHQEETRIPTSQTECADDEIFISGTDFNTEHAAGITTDDDTHWGSTDDDVITPAHTSLSHKDIPSEAELLHNIDSLLDENTNDDNYDDEERCMSLGKTYYNTSQALHSEHGALFKESNIAEVKQLLERGVVTPVPINDPRIKGIPIMKSIKFHLLKYRSDGTIKAKTRWCAADKNGIATNGDPTVCATPSQTTVRLLLAETARLDGTLYSADVPNAFAVGDERASKAVMFAPPGEKEYDSAGNEIVYIVLNIYGRQTAGRVYQDVFNKDMEGIGAVRSQLDPCLYEFPAKQGRGRILVCAWIDDLLISTSCPKAAKWMQKQLKQKYERIKGDDVDFRIAKHVLGMDVVQAKEGIHISQGKLIDQLLDHYKMTTARGAPTPVPTGTKITKEDCPAEPESHDYRHGTAVILYLSTVTRPDLCYTASQLGRVQAAPGKQHMAALLNVCRYLKNTRNHGLLFKRGNQRPTDNMLESYADAGWASVDTNTIAPEVEYAQLPRDNGKSSGGYLVCYNGAPIEFKSKVINTVCLSTAEAELKAAAECAKAILHIRKLVEEVSLHTLDTPTKIYEDASAVIAQCEGTNYTVSSRVRHIGVAFWFLRQLVQESKKVVLVKIGTTEQLADILTKFLSKALHQGLANQLITAPPQ